jgi:hypothetical protein
LKKNLINFKEYFADALEALKEFEEAELNNNQQ